MKRSKASLSVSAFSLPWISQPGGAVAVLPNWSGRAIAGQGRRRANLAPRSGTRTFEAPGGEWDA